MSKNFYIGILAALIFLGGGVFAYIALTDEEEMDDDTTKTETDDDSMKNTETPSTTDTSPTNGSDTPSDSETDETVKYADIEPQPAYELIMSNPFIVVLDVSPNYAQGHLPGAINHYVGDGSLDDAIPTLDKTKMYLVYCHNDSASISGAQKLIDAGFQMVYRLKGNYSAWIDAGLPIEK